MNMKLTSVERFIYFIVKESRTYAYEFKEMHPVTKLKHYLYMSNWVNNKYKFNLSRQEIYGQVMTAMDSEWSYALKQCYENNKWDYYFESGVTLDTDSTSFETEIENDKINVLNDYSVSDKTPTVGDVEDEMLEQFKEDYLDFQLNDTDDEGILQESYRVIKMPEKDSMVKHLNELCDKDTGELILDTLSDDDAIDLVSNDAIAAAMGDDYKNMLIDLETNIGFKSDIDVVKAVTEYYIDTMLSSFDIYTWLLETESKGEENE